MNKQEFVKGINKLEMAYNQKFTKEKLQLWYEKLCNMNDNKFIGRINDLIKTNKYLPNIAEILDCGSSKQYANYDQREYGSIYFDQLYANKGE